MSRKWTNLFRKKSSKADSHGTTAADEELQFQPVPPQRKAPTRLSAMQSNSQALPMHRTGDRSTLSVDDMQKERFLRQSKKGNKDHDRKAFANNKENYRENWITDKLQNLNVDGGKTTAKEQSTNPEKILPKQGGFLEPPRDYNVGSQGKDVSINDEYSDPFDALKQRALERGKKGIDGYTEPYKAQQMHFEIAAQAASSGQGSHNEGAFDGNYHEPWNKKNESMDYEDPWDSNKQATLPYVAKKASDGSLHFDTERLQMHRKLHNGRHHNDSLSSVASSGSSASPSTAAHRLVRVEHPRTSPKSSPHFDRRLVLAKAHGYNNYSEPWGNQSKFKPIDKRLIKAEPSLEELRRMSPGGRSSPGTGSPLSSGRGSPDVSQSQLARMSPLTASNSQALPPHLISINKSKSRSLDMRNNTVAFVAALKLSGHVLPKSASDDHLTSASSCHCIAPTASGQQLNGLCEHEEEEPWDRSTHEQSNAYNNVSHGRSRSYDIQGSPLARRQFLSSTMRPGVTMHDDSFYEHPSDKDPADHLQSMQRFQQRRLELHPTEAINTRDFDPLRPLESQTWYHSAITRDEAEARLSEKLHGSFLVRKSESTKDSYSLSVQSSTKGCIHMLLRCTRDDNWILGEFSAPFLSAPEMVAYYTRNRLKISDSDYVLLLYPVANTIM